MKAYCLLLILCLLAMACKQNETSNNSKTADIQKPKNIAVPKPAADSTFIRIKQVMQEEFAARELTYELIDKSEWGKNPMQHYVCIFPNDNYTRFNLNIQTYNSTQSAKQEITNLQAEKQKMIEKDEFVLIAYHYLRIDNKVYSFGCTANIDHIRSKIYKRIQKDRQVKDEDTEHL